MRVGGMSRPSFFGLGCDGFERFGDGVGLCLHGGGCVVGGCHSLRVGYSVSILEVGRLVAGLELGITDCVGDCVKG